MFGKKKKIQLVTHDGTFHADDVFAAAALTMWLERQGTTYQITRTRDQQTIDNADYVFDIGRIYDHQKGRYDHHQRGNAGAHGSGITYAAFGLIWKHYGLDLCDGNQGVFESVEHRLVEPIDASDNGIDLIQGYTFEDRRPYGIHDFFATFRPTWQEDFHPDIGFFKLLPIARIIIEREITKAIHWRKAYDMISDQLSHYSGEIGELDIPFQRQQIISVVAQNSELDFIYIIYPTDDGVWRILAVREDPSTFVNKLDMPESWRGLVDEELQKVTGVEDAMFCHASGFLAGTKTREGARALAQAALDARV